MSVHVTEKHLATAEKLVSKAHANGGLAPMDLDRFWADQKIARADPFGEDIPQVPFGAICNWECVFAELGVEQDWARYNRDIEWRLSLNKAYNDKAEKIVGRRLPTLHIFGGGSQNKLLNQLAADATGRNVVAGPVEATAIGNILVQAVALGDLADIAEARALVRRSFPVETYEPRDTAGWDAAYERYLNLDGQEKVG